MKQQDYLSASVCFAGLLTFFTLISCTHEPELAGLEPVCFDTQVLPILQTSCGMAGCHTAGEHEFSVSGYDAVMDFVKPGDPRDSRLYTAITDINGDHFMPPDRPLTQLQRNIIQVWIAQGAHETICKQDTGSNQTNEICFVQDILPIMLSGCGVAGCHDAITHEEGQIYTDYNTILAHGIVPFNPEASKVYEVITESGEDRMPPEPRDAFTAEQISAIRKWIEDGAFNSNCPDNVCDTTGVISYIADISPVIQKNCVGCHNSITANGNVNLSSYTNVAAQATIMRAGTSVLYGAVNRMTGFVAMPLTFSLNSCDVDKIKLWIAQGTQNN